MLKVKTLEDNLYLSGIEEIKYRLGYYDWDIEELSTIHGKDFVKSIEYCDSKYIYFTKNGKKYKVDAKGKVTRKLLPIKKRSIL